MIGGRGRATPGQRIVARPRKPHGNPTLECVEFCVTKLASGRHLKFAVVSNRTQQKTAIDPLQIDRRTPIAHVERLLACVRG